MFFGRFFVTEMAECAKITEEIKTIEKIIGESAQQIEKLKKTMRLNEQDAKNLENIESVNREKKEEINETTNIIYELNQQLKDQELQSKKLKEKIKDQELEEDDEDVVEYFDPTQDDKEMIVYQELLNRLINSITNEELKNKFIEIYKRIIVKKYFVKLEDYQIYFDKCREYLGSDASHINIARLLSDSTFNKMLKEDIAKELDKRFLYIQMILLEKNPEYHDKGSNSNYLADYKESIRYNLLEEEINPLYFPINEFDNNFNKKEKFINSLSQSMKKYQLYIRI